MVIIVIAQTAQNFGKLVSDLITSTTSPNLPNSSLSPSNPDLSHYKINLFGT